VTEQIENRHESGDSRFEGGARNADPKNQDPKNSDSKVVSARGTEDGLVLRIDGKAQWDDILHDIELFLGGRKKFFEGGQVSLEWLERLPTVEQSKQLEDLLRNQYGIELVVKRKRPSRLSVAGGAIAGGTGEPGRPFSRENSGSQSISGETNRNDAAGIEAAGLDSGNFVSGKDMSSGNENTVKQKRAGVTINLFDEIASGSLSEAEYAAARESAEEVRRLAESRGAASLGTSSSEGSSLPPGIQLSGREFDPGSSIGEPYSGSKKFASRTARMLGDDLFYEDDANAKIFFGTLRSGQRLETPFSLIVVGDVNPGADLVAGGDIIVFGGLRGTAHASAYDDDAYDRVIIALQMQPMQLRIGSVISRGSDERVRGAEIARIENRRIIVEAFHPKSLAGAGAAGKKFR